MASKSATTVRAKRPGFYRGHRIRQGQTFPLVGGDEMGSWMEKVSGDGDEQMMRLRDPATDLSIERIQQESELDRAEYAVDAKPDEIDRMSAPGSPAGAGPTAPAARAAADENDKDEKSKSKASGSKSADKK